MPLFAPNVAAGRPSLDQSHPGGERDVLFLLPQANQISWSRRQNRPKGARNPDMQGRAASHVFLCTALCLLPQQCYSMLCHAILYSVPTSCLLILLFMNYGL